mmetsp:Transcript_146002/g.466642  ORF Transcript_146002/g.466642 Transcript_146002/m.466642 type:complete len:161 (-) Transcript_146002:124-606(-)
MAKSKAETKAKAKAKTKAKAKAKVDSKAKAKAKVKGSSPGKEPRRAADDSCSATGVPKHMWLITVEKGGAYEKSSRKMELYSTKEKAIAGAPKLMDSFSDWGADWRCGLEGLGKEGEENYTRTKDERKSVGDCGIVFLIGDTGSSQSYLQLELHKMDVCA